MTWDDDVYEALDRANRRAEKAQVERDRLLSIMETIANNYDCDPRAEAREALEGKP